MLDFFLEFRYFYNFREKVEHNSKNIYIKRSILVFYPNLDV